MREGVSKGCGVKRQVETFQSYTWMTCCLEADSCAPARCDTLPSITRALMLHKQTHKRTHSHMHNAAETHTDRQNTLLLLSVAFYRISVAE